MRRVLLTGASGFVGRFALQHLIDRGLEVHAVSRRRPAGVPDGVVWHEADLLAPAEIERVTDAARADVLLHLAWYAEPGAYWTSPLNLDWLAASLLLARAFAGRGGRRVVVAGTCAEYDWGHGTCVERVTPLVPATLYGTAKDALRRVLESYATGHELSFAWGRIFLLYGPGEDVRRLVSSVTCGLLEGRRTATTAGDQVRDFMHVDDVAGALVALSLSSVSGPVNIAHGKPLRLRDVIRQIAGITGRPELLDMGALAMRPDDPPELLADVTRLRDEVGFEPRWSLSDGLLDTVNWWRARITAPGALG